MVSSMIALVASLGAASAFAPVSSFSGVQLTQATSSSAGPQMLFKFGQKKDAAVKEVKQVAAAASKATRPLRTTGSKVQSQAQSQSKSVVASAKKTFGQAKRAAPSAPQAPAPLRKAVGAAKRAAAEVAAPSNPGDFAIQFGSDVEAPYWDPAGLALDKPAETMEWYRAAELKHGRVAMLAALGTFVNAAGIALPDSVFSGTTKSFDALAQVADQRPGALIQIVLAIAAVEALTVQLPEGDFPGDLGFDPANQAPTFERQGKFDELRLKELKNGRLAMIGIAGMWVQEALTGQGVFEQLASGHLSPVNDGQGYF